jgi:2-polyprenyl-6-methoxyphenol hydroxylase-like FAD-dependent oxidoreductase
MMTEQALRDRLAAFGRAPEYGCELGGFDDGPDGVVVRLVAPRGEAVVHTRWLIGADGGRSFVRQALGVEFPGETLPIRGLVADVQVPGLSREVWHRWMGGDEGQVSLCPLSGTDLFQLQAALLQPGDPELSAAGLSALLARRTGRDDLAVGEVAWASAFGMNARLAERYRVGHVLLVGDAAHVHPPTGGQGLNTSVQDAYNLGWKLAAVLDGAGEDLIDTYEEERRPIAASVLGLSQTLLSSAQSGVMRRGRESQELDLTYAGSSLALDLRAAPGRVVPGDRAPDAPLAEGRLFERMAGPHWTLIGHGVGPEGAPARPGLVVVSAVEGVGQAFAAIYDLSPATWVLVRPDGYVGAIAPAGHEGALGDYLARTSPVRRD